MTNLNDKELGQVSGGITYGITSLHAGDVLLENIGPTYGVVITRDYPFLTQSDRVAVYYFYIDSNGVPQIDPYLSDISVSNLSDRYTYSPSLTGTIPYN